MMRNDEGQVQIKFEIYKIHAELAERAAQSREDVNKVFAGIVVSIIGAQVLIYRLTPDAGMVWFLLVLGIFVSLAWSLSLHSMKSRLKAKNQVLRTMERDLPFPFFTNESDEYEKLLSLRRQISEQVFPLALGACCLGSLVFEAIKSMFSMF